MTGILMAVAGGETAVTAPTLTISTDTGNSSAGVYDVGNGVAGYVGTQASRVFAFTAAVGNGGSAAGAYTWTATNVSLPVGASISDNGSTSNAFQVTVSGMPADNVDYSNAVRINCSVSATKTGWTSGTISADPGYIYYKRT